MVLISISVTSPKLFWLSLILTSPHHDLYKRKTLIFVSQEGKKGGGGGGREVGNPIGLMGLKEGNENMPQANKSVLKRTPTFTTLHLKGPLSCLRHF